METNRWSGVIQYWLDGLRWLVVAAALGGVCGALGAGFHHAIDVATELRGTHPALMLLLPVGGVVTLLLYRLGRVSFDAGTNLILTAVSREEEVPILLAPLVVVGTVLSHLLGASVGREGAALQLGGSIGHNVGKWLHMEKEEVRTAAMCGMAACFSAMFGTPLAAAVFVLEVARVGVMRYHALLPCVAASYLAYLTSLSLGAEPLRFALEEIPALTGGNVLRVAALGLGCAGVSVVLCVALEGGGHLAKRCLPNPYLRIALGGAVMAAVTAALGLFDYAGAGTPLIRQAMAGAAPPWAFAIKIALTALCVSAGFRGGEIVPTLFVGATFGCVAAPVLGLTPGFGAAVGMTALFCAVVNCPVATLFLAAELFSTGELGLFAVAVTVAFVASGYFGLYSSQVVEFSKVRNQANDRRTG